MRTVLMVSALSAAALMGFSQAQAHGPGASSPVAPMSSFHSPKPPKPVLHVPIGSYTSLGDNEATTGTSNYNNVDAPLTFNCPNANGCTVLVHATVQAKSATDTNQWAICPFMDGGSVFDGCEFISYLDIADLWETASTDSEFTVARGKHTTNTTVYFSAAGATVANYHVTYEILTP